MKLKKKLMSLALIVAMAVCMLPMSKASKVEAENKTWTLRVDNEEDVVTYQGTSGEWNGLILDGTSGKIYVRTQQWAQFTEGAIIKVPVDGACEITVSAYSTGYTVNGEAATAKSQTFTYTGEAGYVNIVSTDGSGYIDTISVADIDVSLLPGNVGDKTWDLSTIDVIFNGNSGKWQGLLVDATNGKLQNNNGGWAQFNTDTVISVPVDGNCDITVVTYSVGHTVNGIAATNTTETFTYEGEAGYVDIVATASNYIKTITTVHTASDEDTDGTTQGDMYVQYKEQQDGKYTLRFVVPVAVNSIDTLDGVGVSMTVNERTEVVTGKDLFASVYANGEVVNAPNEYAFAVIELTNVPVGTEFTEVKPAYVPEIGETTYGSSFTYTVQ